MNTNFFSALEGDLVANNTVPGNLYEELDVKRGLRNADGSGVLAGLSRISSVVGSKKEDGKLIPVDGMLRYRGVAISELVDQLDASNHDRFERTLFLLMVGRMPSDDEHQQLRSALSSNYIVDSAIVEHAIKSLPSPNIMNKLQTVVSALYTQDSDPEGVEPLKNFEKSVGLIAKLPMVVAYGYLAHYADNPTYVSPLENGSIAESFLHMLRQGAPVDDLEAEILDLALLLHAEHGGGNNSTFTTYVVSSSGTDVYGAITAALGSLKGPLHGAANKMVMEMMADIKSNVSDWADESEVERYLEKIVRKKAHNGLGKLYGLGHAVYTKSDPRAVVLKSKAQELAQAKGRLDEFNLYNLIASKGPEVFQSVKGSSKVIAPNVDFYSGFVYDCLGIPQEVYTPLFAMARSVGWASHRIEEALSGKRVIRPGYKYV